MRRRDNQFAYRRGLLRRVRPKGGLLRLALQSDGGRAVQPPADCRGRFLKERCAKLLTDYFKDKRKNRQENRKQNTDLNSVGIFYCLFCGFVQVVDKVLGLHLKAEEA